MKSNLKFETNPKTLKFPVDSFLWKYMDIHRFLAFMLNNSIYFSRMDLLEDKNEGITFNILMLKHLQKNEPNESNINPLLTDDMKAIIFEKKLIREKLILDDLEFRQRTNFLSCWYLHSHESMAMWGLYSHVDSVAVKFNAINLINTVRESLTTLTESKRFFKLLAGKVLYRNFRIIHPFLDPSILKVKYPALRKDLSFQHEKEFRFVLQSKNIQNDIKGAFLKIADFNKMDFSVICHPRMEEWKKKNIGSLLKTYGLENKLMDSEIELR